MFKGYTCAKGRALPAIHNNPERLLSSQKRGADGTFARIEAQQAMDEIAAKLHLVDRRARAALGGAVSGHQRSALSGVGPDG